MLKKILAGTVALSLLGISLGCSTDALKQVLGDKTSSGSTTTTTPSTSTTTDYKPAVDAFKTEFNTEGKTPQGSVKMLFKALIKIEEDPKLGEYLLSVVLRADEMSENKSSPSGYDVGSSMRYLLDQMKASPQIVRSYVGAKPADDYQNFDKNNLVIDYPANGTLTGGVKIDNTLQYPDKDTDGRIYVKSSGKDTGTPIYFKKGTTGLWKIESRSVSSIATGVQAKPKEI